MVSVPTAATATFRGSHTRRGRSLQGPCPRFLSVSAQHGGQPLRGHHFQAQFSCLPGTSVTSQETSKESSFSARSVGIGSDAAPLPSRPGAAFPPPGRAQSPRLSTALARLPWAARCLLPHIKEPACAGIHFSGAVPDGQAHVSPLV